MLWIVCSEETAVISTLTMTFLCWRFSACMTQMYRSELHRPGNSAIPPLWSHVLVCLGKLIMYFETRAIYCILSVQTRCIEMCMSMCMYVHTHMRAYTYMHVGRREHTHSLWFCLVIICLE